MIFIMKIEVSLLICNIKGIFNMSLHDDMSIIYLKRSLIYQLFIQENIMKFWKQ